MKPSIKFGLIAGAIGLVANICVNAAIGICGPCGRSRGCGGCPTPDLDLLSPPDFYILGVAQV